MCANDTHVIYRCKEMNGHLGIPSPLATCYSGRVAENGIGLPSRSNATQTGYESIAYTLALQIVSRLLISICLLYSSFPKCFAYLAKFYRLQIQKA